MKQKTNVDKKPLSRDDTVMYRLIFLFFFGIVGFAALRLAGSAKNMFYSLAFQIVCGLVLVAAIVAPIYGKYVLGFDGKNRIFTFAGASAVIIPIAVMSLLYTQFNKDADAKLQIVFVIDILLLIIYNLNLTNAFGFSVIAASEALMLSLIKTTPYGIVEKVLVYGSRALVFIVPALVASFCLYSLISGKNKLSVGKIKINMPGKTCKTLLTAFSVIAVISAAVILLVPSVFLYVLCTFIGVYLVLGIISTVKVI